MFQFIKKNIALTESNIPCLSSGHSHFSLQFTAPCYGTTSILKHETSSGYYIFRSVGNSMIPISCKISISKIFKTSSRIRSKNKFHILIAIEALSNSHYIVLFIYSIHCPSCL